VTADSGRPASHAGDRDDDSLLDVPSDTSAEALREILFGDDRQHIAELETELDELERRITDEDALISIIAPVLAGAIHRKIGDARQEMVEALYPIIGQIIVRAASQSLRGLGHNVGVRIRSWAPQALWQRTRTRPGAPGAETAPQTTPSGVVAEVFLIHREMGLLLWHVSGTSRATRDPLLTRETLAAIHDFRQATSGPGEAAQRDEVCIGERRILMEAADHTCLGVVIRGGEPPGVRAKMHQTITEVEHAYLEALRHSDSDPPRRLRVQESLNSLMTAAPPRPGLSARQKRAFVAALCLVVICLAGAYLVWGRPWWLAR
jgi:hypothetical protein